jgi:hypothetical protein
MNEYIKVNPIGGASLSPTGNYTVNSLDLTKLTVGSGPELTMLGGVLALDGDGAGNGDLGSLATLTLYGDIGVSGFPYLTLPPGGITEIGVATAGSFQVTVNSVPSIKVDGSIVAGETRLQLYDIDSGINQRVKVTANNAVLGVTGRVLYVDNI